MLRNTSIVCFIQSAYDCRVVYHPALHPLLARATVVMDSLTRNMGGDELAGNKYLVDWYFISKIKFNLSICNIGERKGVPHLTRSLRCKYVLLRQDNPC